MNTNMTPMSVWLDLTIDDFKFAFRSHLAAEIISDLDFQGKQAWNL
jgi:hypothetical protein